LKIEIRLSDKLYVSQAHVMSLYLLTEYTPGSTVFGSIEGKGSARKQ
jgi:hypothetical protein